MIREETRLHESITANRSFFSSSFCVCVDFRSMDLRVPGVKGRKRNLVDVARDG